MGYRVKPFTMAVRDNSTQEFIDVGLLGTDVDGEIEDLNNKTLWVTPEQFDAVGDGVTDDSLAISAAVATGKLVIATGDYKIRQDLVFNGYKKFYCSGKIILNGSSVIVKNEQNDIFINSIIGTGSESALLITEPDQLDPLLGVTSFNNITVRDIHTANYALDLQSRVEHRGIQYNTITIERITTCNRALNMLASVTSSWINQNVFDIQAIGGTVTHTVAYGIYAVNTGSGEICGNLFKNTGFEGISAQAIHLENCIGNIFENIRLAELTTNDYWVYMLASGCNTFSGYLSFDVAKISDNPNQAWGLEADYNHKNIFVFENAQHDGDSFIGPGRVFSYRGQFVGDEYMTQHSNNVIAGGSNDVDLRTYTSNILSDNIRINIDPGHSITVPYLFKNAMTGFIVNISEGTGSITIYDKNGSTWLATITGAGHHVCKWTNGRMIHWAASY